MKPLADSRLRLRSEARPPSTHASYPVMTAVSDREVLILSHEAAKPKKLRLLVDGVYMRNRASATIRTAFWRMCQRVILPAYQQRNRASFAAEQMRERDAEQGLPKAHLNGEEPVYRPKRSSRPSGKMAIAAPAAASTRTNGFALAGAGLHPAIGIVDRSQFGIDQ